MKRVLLLMSVLFMFLCISAQNRLYTEQELKLNFSERYSHELNFLLLLAANEWPRPGQGECGSEGVIQSSRIVRVYDIQQKTAKAVVEYKEECDGSIKKNQEELSLVLENGEWKIGDYANSIKLLKKDLQSRGIKPEMLTDLISISDILKTNGDLSSLVKTHGFKKYSYISGRGAEFFKYYKNCALRDDDLVPQGKGTSIIIAFDYNINSTNYTISVFNSKAYTQLVAEIMSIATTIQDDYNETKYTLKWANGKTITATCSNEVKGGYIYLSKENR